MSLRKSPRRGETRRRRFSVYIPARYAVRPSRAQRVVPFLLFPCAVFLLAVCLGEPPPSYDPFYTWVLLALGVLAALAVLWGMGVRELCLSVEGDTLTYRRRGRPEEVFSFSAVGFVLSRRGRETVVLYDAKRQVLCRLSVAMDGLDVLLADLRSRGARFLDHPPKSWDRPVPPLTPGPRKEELTLDLPARVPDWYQLRNPGLYTLLFSVLGGGSALAALAALVGGGGPAALCFLPFALGGLWALALVRRERIQGLGDRLRCRPLRGPEREIRFEEAAAVRLSTAFTGIGPVSGLRLLDREGKVLLAPSPGMEGTDLLLADLIDRGIPFTY